MCLESTWDIHILNIILIFREPSLHTYPPPPSPHNWEALDWRVEGSSWSTTPNSDLNAWIVIRCQSDFSEDCALAGMLMSSQGVDVLQKGTLQKRGSHLYSQATILCRKNINEIWIGIRHQERTAAVRGNLNCTMNYTWYSESPCAILKSN